MPHLSLCSEPHWDCIFYPLCKNSLNTQDRGTTQKRKSCFHCMAALTFLWSFKNICGRAGTWTQILEAYSSILITRLLLFLSDGSPSHLTCALSTTNTFAACTGWTLVWAGGCVDTVAGAPGKGSDVPWVWTQEQQPYVGITGWSPLQGVIWERKDRHSSSWSCPLWATSVWH